MIIIIARHNFQCYKKEFVDINIELETRLRKVFRILNNPNSIVLDDIQTSSSLKNKCLEFDNDQDTYRPLRALLQQINKLPDDEHVSLLDGTAFDSKWVFIWCNILKGKKYACNPIHVWKEMNIYFHFPRYKQLLFAKLGYDQYIGEIEKSKRVCRFCGTKGDKPNIFGNLKNSHAISLFLGNDSIFCLEECKSCNEKFGRGIEGDLDNYYNAYRALEERASREGNPLSLHSFNCEKIGNRLNYYSSHTEHNQPMAGERIPKEGLMIHIDEKNPVCLHNVYKVMVKYVIACLPNEYLPYFKTTVEWIMRKKKPRRHSLPPLYRIETLPEVKNASLSIYIRQDEKKDMPYCIGELRFMENLYIFAVPYCKDKDVMHPYLANQLDKFVQTRYRLLLKKYKFTIENFCDDELKLITTHVKIEGEGTLQQMTEEEHEVGSIAWAKHQAEMLRKCGTTDLHPNGY